MTECEDITSAILADRTGRLDSRGFFTAKLVKS